MSTNKLHLAQLLLQYRVELVVVTSPDFHAQAVSQCDTNAVGKGYARVNRLNVPGILPEISIHIFPNKSPRHNEPVNDLLCAALPCVTRKVIIDFAQVQGVDYASIVFVRKQGIHEFSAGFPPKKRNQRA
ncbi:MAG: hypothetical protein NT018_14750 [Armatimonadetes bacterium]|nr:hypothetical protein [Armatimonadota bacterium]